MPDERFGLPIPRVAGLPAVLDAPPPMPTDGPGLATTPVRSSVLEGAFAEATLNGFVIALLFDWKLRVRTRKAEFTGAGDKYAVWVPLDVDWSVTAQGYVDPIGAANYLNAGLQLSNIPLLTFRGYRSAASVPAALIWQGTCFLDDGEISMPMALATQSMTLQGTGPPTAGVPA